MRLNLGCGAGSAEGFVNVDIVPLPGVNVVCDLDAGWPFGDGAAEYILASHVYEHLWEPVHFMAEAHRVLEPGGMLDIRVPYYKHPNAFTDPTHRRFCTESTFDYWIAGAPLHAQFGASMGSPPAVFDPVKRSLGRYDGDVIPNEVRVILGKQPCGS